MEQTISKNLVFHARPSKDNKHPTHTLCFNKYNDNVLLCTFAKPHPKLENYSKKKGYDCAKGRMNSLLNQINTQPSTSIHTYVKDDTIKQLKKYTPSCVRKTLSFYANRAKKYFKMSENPSIIIRGQYADWETYIAKYMENKVEVTNQIISTNLDNL